MCSLTCRISLILLLLFGFFFRFFDSLHEKDGSFFEKYSGLQWKLDQRRLEMIKESQQEEGPPPEMSIGVKPPHVSTIQSKEVRFLSFIEIFHFEHRKISNE